MMVRAVRLTPAAADDLERLVDFLSQKNERAAQSAATSIERAVLSLAELSERGRMTTVPGLRELVVRFGRDAYIIQYRVDADSVVVARVFHSLEQH